MYLRFVGTREERGKNLSLLKPRELGKLFACATPTVQRVVK